MKRFCGLPVVIVSFTLSLGGCGPSPPPPAAPKSEAAKQEMSKVQMDMSKKAAEAAAKGGRP
jgi:hypothetical protein